MTKKIINILGKVLLIFSVVFVVIKVHRLGIDFSATNNIPGLLLASALSLTLSIAGTFLLAFIWGEWISALSEKKVSRIKVFTIYGKSAIGKYLPGNVMHYVERNIFAADYGLSQKMITFSTIMEIFAQVISALIVSAVILPVHMWKQIFSVIEDRIYLLLILGAVCVIAVPVLLIFMIKKFGSPAKLLGRSPVFLLKALPKALLLSIIYVLINGLGMLLISGTSDGFVLSPDSVRLILSSYSAAWVCGFVIPGAPGGIGVREAILSVLLEDTLGSSLMFIVIFHRLITIAGDFCVYIISRFLLPLADRRSADDESSIKEPEQ